MSARGAKRTSRDARYPVAIEGKADVARKAHSVAFDARRTFTFGRLIGEEQWLATRVRSRWALLSRLRIPPQETNER
jgi:hypothetical protein